MDPEDTDEHLCELWEKRAEEYERLLDEEGYLAAERYMKLFRKKLQVMLAALWELYLDRLAERMERRRDLGLPTETIPS
jgi:hypothetical protein